MPSFKTTLPCSDIEVTVEYSIRKEYGEHITEIESVQFESGAEVPYKKWWYYVDDPRYTQVVKRSMLSYFEEKVEEDFDLEEFAAGAAEARSDERNER